MINQLLDVKPILTARWSYAEEMEREVRIIRHDVLYGTGDYEDEPDVAEDRQVECFYILYQTACGEPQWTGGGAAMTLADAKHHVEAVLGKSLQWIDWDK